MKGFDEKWKDFPDYILGITKEIWEDRQLHTLNRYYAKDVIVRTPLTISQGNTGVINSTMEVLAEFPDRTLLGEDVIWSGDDESGLYSSHRIISTATHRETNKKIFFRIIADCHALNNQIDDEWLIRDHGAIAKHLGMTAKEQAIKAIEESGGLEQCPFPFTPEKDFQGPYTGVGNDNEWGEKYQSILQRIMNAEFSVIPQEYDRACLAEYPSGTQACSHLQIDDFWMRLRSAFPNAEFKIHNRIGRNDEMMSPRAAIRWSLQGKHEGYGHFGAPTGAQVYIMGAAHAEFGPWGVRREYVLFDEVAIWKQILLNSRHRTNS
ncbi:nuclear transport factor 2 family protein [Vibrio algarum]|uniref:Nuclear transport factor 2 family protein n=1 Tax=Vibrio algarum TaxID=3020714 RepID=A0ABT4YTZ7_9VIBR|nr:nuclear transport factor 2 family protein [Vibrio sp. KJ40-1]MDB1125047.1 nuclear transport factor 2 family protein [Vibrio sp. KJ40-1]